MTRTVVVDGSNLATEGRPLPSLRQLQEAVAAFREEHPDDQIIIVADATFGHRIESKEVEEFDLLVDHGQITCPPAGAVGRGDAFVLSIANKAKATVLSNDSFQEFHGTYTWLFDEGRLVGGKPVPHIGWVFVPRTPVRGPVSRKAVQQAKKGGRGGQAPAKAVKASKEAFQPMPVPKVPPPSRVKKVDMARSASPAGSGSGSADRDGGVPPAKGASINDLLPFLEFVELHPVGSQVDVVFDTYSSHGAYATAHGVRIYVPLRLMGDPAPRSAREVVKVGEARTVVIAGFNAARRGIDAAFAEPIGAAPAAVAEASSQPSNRSRGRGRDRDRDRGRGRGRSETAAPSAAMEVAVFDFDSAAPVAAATESSRGTRPRRNPPVQPAPEPAAPTKAPAKRAGKAAQAAKSPTKKASPSKSAPKKAPAAGPATATKASSKKAPAKASSPESAPTTSPTAAKAPAKKAPAKKAPVTKAPVTKAPVTKAPVTKAPAKKAPAKKAPAANS